MTEFKLKNYFNGSDEIKGVILDKLKDDPDLISIIKDLTIVHLENENKQLRTISEQALRLGKHTVNTLDNTTDMFSYGFRSRAEAIVYNYQKELNDLNYKLEKFKK